MGTSTRGMDEWIADLETLAERAEEKFPRLLGRGALNIKNDWRARWQRLGGTGSHIPHLPRGIGYDVRSRRGGWEAEIGVSPDNRQAFLATIIEYGTLTSRPHPGGIPALDREDPRFVRAVATLAEELLHG